MKGLFKNVSKSVFRTLAIGILLIYMTGCSTKMTVDESPTAASEKPETAEAPATQEQETVEIIPLDEEATSAESEQEDNTTSTADMDTVAESAEESMAATEEPAPAQESMPHPDIANMIGELTEHRNTLWRSRSSAYVLYIGGILTAKYSPGNETLTLHSEKAGTDMECKYSITGELDAQDNEKQRACSDLVKALKSYISS